VSRVPCSRVDDDPRRGPSAEAAGMLTQPRVQSLRADAVACRGVDARSGFAHSRALRNATRRRPPWWRSILPPARPSPP